MISTYCGFLKYRLTMRLRREGMTDIVTDKNKNICKIIDFAVPFDSRVIQRK